MHRILMTDPDKYAQGLYRAKYPVQFCKEELAAQDIELVLNHQLDLNQHWDAIILHRIIRPHWLEVFKEIQDLGIKIAIEFDDDIWSIPAWNPAAQVIGQTERDCLSWSIDNADMVMVSTDHLKLTAERHLSKPSGQQCDKVKVVPNLLDCTSYTSTPRPPDGMVRILWAGSAHHEKDLDELVEPLDRIMKEYKERVQVLFFGNMPYAFVKWQPVVGTNLAKMVPCDTYGSSLGLIDYVNLESYAAALCEISPDIALCPLCDDEFNYSKSNNKAAEMALAGAAVIATDLHPYRPMGDDALLVKPGDAKGWYSALKGLIEDDSWRKLMASRAKTRITREWCWQGKKKDIWLNAFKELVA